MVTRTLSAEADAWAWFEALRWPDGPICPHCGHAKAYFIAPAGGSRRNTNGSQNYRRIWRCASCRHQFSALVGTPLSDTKMPMATWRAVFDQLGHEPNMSVRRLAAEVGIAASSARLARARVRLLWERAA